MIEPTAVEHAVAAFFDPAELGYGAAARWFAHRPTVVSLPGPSIRRLASQTRACGAEPLLIEMYSFIEARFRQPLFLLHAIAEVAGMTPGT
ncbi:hypothetical protein ACIBCD_41720 [Nocardia brasiliensis]|uniref:hypothetical protein n=1 Tax=Nocardia brasiliensis TaxID=37326 RepID=UPI0037934019